MADDNTADATVADIIATPKPTAAPRRRTAKPRARKSVSAKAPSPATSTIARVKEEANAAELDLEAHVASLTDQLADLAERVERLAARSAAGARDLVAGAGYAGAMATRRAGRQIGRTARAVRGDPLPTVVTLGVLALVTAVILSRRDERW